MSFTKVRPRTAGLAALTIAVCLGAAPAAEAQGFSFGIAGPRGSFGFSSGYPQYGYGGYHGGYGYNVVRPPVYAPYNYRYDPYRSYYGGYRGGHDHGHYHWHRDHYDYHGPGHHRGHRGRW
ncbi:MAG: hypothetical protein ACRC1K_12665 [Planctomycetia bacterium]